MGKPVTLKIYQPSMSPGYHEKWKTCRICGDETNRVELKFDSGSTLPVTDEVLTGVTSGDTGIVEEVELISGAWGDGDAAGFIELTSPTGIEKEEEGVCFEDDELIDGSTGGASMLTADGDGIWKLWGVFYPKRLMIKDKGSWLCKYHAEWRMRPRERDKEKLIIKETERGKE